MVYRPIGRSDLSSYTTDEYGRCKCLREQPGGACAQETGSSGEGKQTLRAACKSFWEIQRIYSVLEA